MLDAAWDSTSNSLNLLEELVLLLLNNESGYFHQVPGWHLNCAVVGAVLAELSLSSRIDTDAESLLVLDSTKTGDGLLDPTLQEIAGDSVSRSPQYWIERLTPRAESIVDMTLERLVARGILHHHPGGFWTLSRTTGQTQWSTPTDDMVVEFVKARIGNVIFDDEIPHPRDVIIVCLVNTCDVFRFIFPLDKTSLERIQLICRMDVIGRSITSAIEQSLQSPLLNRPVRTRPIPTVPIRDLLVNRHARVGNLPAFFADLARRNGPVFEIRLPLAKSGMIWLAGTETNQWVNRFGRHYLRSKDYLEDFEKVYGASRILPSMDGADHFRMRKAMRGAYSRASLEERLDEVYGLARAYMAKWRIGDALPAVATFQEMMNAQISQLSVAIDTQDCITDLLEYKKRSLVTHIQRALPKFMLNTPGMKRRRKQVFSLVDRIRSVHTAAQRVGRPRDLVDDLLSFHASDPQFLPETDLQFALVAPLIVSVYLGNAMSFAVYAMVSQPELYERIRTEADALFADGDPERDAITPSAIDVTHRFLMECMRLYPILPIQIRNVMNGCVIEGHRLPTGSRIYIAQTAAHYMDNVFPEPFEFDIDRYLPQREEHRSPGYAPFGLGTHICLASRWVEVQLAVNLLMVAHHFTFEMRPVNYKLRINPFPTLAPSKTLNFVVAEKRRELASSRFPAACGIGDRLPQV